MLSKAVIKQRVAEMMIKIEGELEDDKADKAEALAKLCCEAMVPIIKKFLLAGHAIYLMDYKEKKYPDAVDNVHCSMNYNVAKDRHELLIGISCFDAGNQEACFYLEKESDKT